MLYTRRSYMKQPLNDLNFSDKDDEVLKRDEKLTDSHWESERMGGTVRGGYNLGEIQWTDLGRKYMIKRGNKTN